MVSFSLYGYGAPLSDPPGRRSSAIILSIAAILRDSTAVAVVRTSPRAIPLMTMTMESFSVAFTANTKRLSAVSGFPSPKLTSAWRCRLLGLHIQKPTLYFEIRPFILSVQARPESTTGFFVFRKNRGKCSRNFLIISGTFWPSLGHLDRQHHVLASV